MDVALSIFVILSAAKDLASSCISESQCVPSAKADGFIFLACPRKTEPERRTPRRSRLTLRARFAIACGIRRRHIPVPTANGALPVRRLSGLVRRQSPRLRGPKVQSRSRAPKLSCFCTQFSRAPDSAALHPGYLLLAAGDMTNSGWDLLIQLRESTPARPAAPLIQPTTERLRRVIGVWLGSGFLAP